MPDWKPHIRSRLASLRLSSSRENEIIEELSGGHPRRDGFRRVRLSQRRELSCEQIPFSEPGKRQLRRFVLRRPARDQFPPAILEILRQTPERIPVVPIDDDNPESRQRMRAAGFLLGVVVAAVLLIACANIASLLLAKATARRRELALRVALGASRARLVRQLLTETVLLSLVGGIVGLGMAWALVHAFQVSPPPPGALPVALDLAIDRRVLLFSIVLSLITGLRDPHPRRPVR